MNISFTKRVILSALLIGIAASIVYLEATKPPRVASSGQDIVLPEGGGSTATTTIADDHTTGASADSPRKTANTTTKPDRSVMLAAKAAQYQRAKELTGIEGYINAPDGFKLSDAVGKKVVLVDFWTYSCINCQRTLPYVTAWYDKYKDKGLVIVGVHTPEFDFEKDKSNVEAAVKKEGINYPVVLDNNYGTWTAYQNHYWPHEYLIDIDGFITHDHIGEGGYAETEKLIQDALAERAKVLGLNVAVNMPTTDMPEPDLSGIHSPETYFGSSRNDYLANGKAKNSGIQDLTIPNDIIANLLYLDGTWNFMPEYAEAGAGARIMYKYNSKDMYFVAAGKDGPVKVKVLRDGKPVGSFAGADVDPVTSEATINGNRLYKFIHDTDSGTHTIEIQIESGTLDVYTFTFG